MNAFHPYDLTYGCIDIYYGHDAEESEYRAGHHWLRYG
jgi:hypothetical protein